ncbi:Nif3-like dinuclear metal center hexameric protein [Ferruginibacter paludis]|uniref:Nif3-like dinuclear metal center hexameric protein n=1 Tax=Ferruginibacter paludis TaxID=1310417 RepID=UPI0025B283C8|nr:Nif3-like dinuclear metal center hexameric protein [Ferruginibacter paludis]MDN3655061.1 Nif3-like dinuclear metal center hexameric protein [Ferruginibacter paludis]
MTIQQICSFLETIAPASLQESYDNAGLLTGDPNRECTGIITALDATEAVVREAIEKNCNLVVAHHPIIFGGLKKITGKNYVEKTIIAAIKNDIAIYAIHTNLDNILTGVNGRMADLLGLVNRRVLQPKKGMVKKLVTFVPAAHAEAVRSALFAAGAGQIGNYSECSFAVNGEGSFKGGPETVPFVGEPGVRHAENELRLETIYPAWVENQVVKALLAVHPYEEPAYDLYLLDNARQQTGSGLMGELPAAVPAAVFLQQLKKVFELTVVRHTPLMSKPVQKIALCGGAGSFLTGAAVAAGADFYVTGDVKYHEFFDANDQLVIADIGHFESEQYTVDLLFDILREKFPNFAVLKTRVKTNPVNYFV